MVASRVPRLKAFVIFSDIKPVPLSQMFASAIRRPAFRARAVVVIAKRIRKRTRTRTSLRYFRALIINQLYATTERMLPPRPSRGSQSRHVSGHQSPLILPYVPNCPHSGRWTLGRWPLVLPPNAPRPLQISAIADEGQEQTTSSGRTVARKMGAANSDTGKGSGPQLGRPRGRSHWRLRVFTTGCQMPRGFCLVYGPELCQ